jgi:alkylhydroperoxidase family enzyme
VQAALSDWRTAPLDAKLRAMLGFIEKLTLAPETVTTADARALRLAGAGLSDAAIEDAIHVCTLFSVYDRLADSFAFHIPDEKAFAQSATRLLTRGYV